MGLFTSHCPHCDADIHWFLRAPDDFVCVCGKPVSEQEIEDSWQRNYREHLESLGITSAPSANTSAETTGDSATGSVP